jgi:glycine/D-amino acid oxidase-like deaminating enzyme
VAEAARRFGCPALAGRVERRPMNATEADDLARSAPILRECGAGVTVSRDGVLRVEEDLLVDVRAFHVGLARGLVAVEPGTPVERLRAESDGVVAETPSGTRRAEMALVACGPHTSEIRPSLERAIFPFRAQGARFRSVFPAGQAFGAVSQFGHENYVVDTAGDLVAFGFNPTGRREDTGFSEEPTREFQSYLVKFARERFPELARSGAEPVHTWAAPLAFTRDGLPVVGPSPGEPRILVAAGFCGRGLPLGFEAGRRIAALVAGEPVKIPTAFSTRRDAAAE